ncbi:HPr family phosphocarrier protein [Marinicauda algicola]|uniref:HPr family phosphocarrier protein n=1 Tax=Marinicauda algicola TaxID=2029849 RepID=A0A4S2H0Z2_9PROT|nr:HPr family phosphocarrier protein [Marinicauda algicola]TGY89217.1 HPr family phosphocarrier protein [Marinicauda algicola]
MSAKKTVTVCNRRGLHARAAAKFVAAARRHSARVTVERDGERVPGSSIMDLLMLAAGPGTQLVIEAEGEEAESAVEDLASLVSSGFEEED